MQQPKSLENDVTLFSNGMGHFRRVYDVKEETTISIPFKKDHIGDVAASLQVFGNVRLTSPPTFTPNNSQSTSLDIDPDDALRCLLSNLSGAEVRVGKGADSKRYTLVGITNEVAYRNDHHVDKVMMILSSGGHIITKACEYNDVEFVEDVVQAEIEKALKNNFQKIKPDSTFVDISLVPKEGETKVTVEYTLPVAAWKMRYAIRQKGDIYTLEGAAIVDNSTDEDWNNFRIAVVTGNPISFSTDIANVVVPDRRFVRLVDNQALGNVENEIEICSAGGTRGVTRGVARTQSLGIKSSVANYADFALESCGDPESFAPRGYAAEAPEMINEEVGDFSIFRSKDVVSVLARKSAVVPMFLEKLGHAGTVVLYKEQNHATRPYRAVKFKNETAYTLGKGKTLIYNESVFSGECVLDTTKPGENRMLAHCLENGVKIKKKGGGVESRLNSFKFSEGSVLTESVSATSTEYKISNKKDEKFKVALEHESYLGMGKGIMASFSGVEVVEREELSRGWRVYFVLDPMQELTLNVDETRVEQRTVNMNGNLNWINHNIIHVDNPLKFDEKVMSCLEIQKRIDEATDGLSEANERRRKMESKANRIRQNVEAAKGTEGSATKIEHWLDQLEDIEKGIAAVDEVEEPEYRDRISQLNKDLAASIRQLTVSWSNKTEASKIE